MNTLWGAIVVVFALLAWGGQAISWFAPSLAVKLTLAEAEDAVEPVYFADIRGEALWDAFTLWIMLVAGVLLISNSSAWAYFGLVGGGTYVYFAGRGIATRVSMQHRGYRIGTAQNVRLGYILLTVWGAMGLVTIIAAIVALRTS